MSKSQERRKLVAFYEVREANGGVIKEPTPWAEHLAELARETTAQREHPVNGIPHWGQVHTYGYAGGPPADHLVLARLRDGVSSLNTTTGQIIDSESNANNPWVEVSVIHFLPNTNRFGFVLGSNASPHESSLASWINQHHIFEEEITVAPVISSKVAAKLQGAAEASMLRVQFDSTQIAALQSTGGLYTANQSIKNEIGSHVSVELVIKVEGGVRGKGRTDERIRLLDTARGVAGHDFKKAIAKLIDYGEDGEPHAEDVNFLNHRLAMRKRVLITDHEGRQVRINSALDAIYKAAEHLSDELYGV